MSEYVNGMDWCGVWDEEKKRKRRMGKRRMWEKDVGEWQNSGTVQEECQGQGECLMSVTSTLSLFKKKKKKKKPLHCLRNTLRLVQL